MVIKDLLNKPNKNHEDLSLIFSLNRLQRRMKDLIFKMAFPEKSIVTEMFYWARV